MVGCVLFLLVLRTFHLIPRSVTLVLMRACVPVLVHVRSSDKPDVDVCICVVRSI